MVDEKKDKVTVTDENEAGQGGLRSLPRNVWAASFTSLFNDVSSEMVINVLPLFPTNVLGGEDERIGSIEGLAESTASLLKVFPGGLSDKLQGRKWVTVSGWPSTATLARRCPSRSSTSLTHGWRGRGPGAADRPGDELAGAARRS
jgi:hypothetical protein